MFRFEFTSTIQDLLDAEAADRARLIRPSLQIAAAGVAAFTLFAALVGVAREWSRESFQV